MRTLDDLVGSGKVGYIGFSNVPAGGDGSGADDGLAQLEHLEGNLDEVTLTQEQIARLSHVSQPELNYPAGLHGELRAMLQFAGTTVRPLASIRRCCRATFATEVEPAPPRERKRA